MSRDEPRDDVLGQLAPMHRYARALTRDEAQAEDLVHDALVRAYERRSTFRDGGTMRTWLLSILHNTFMDGRRREMAQRRRETEAAQSVEPSTLPSQESSIQLQQVRRAFAALPEEQRAVLHLVTIEGLSYLQAAETLGIPVGTLMSRLGRARTALRTFEADGAQAGVPALPEPPGLPPALRPNLRIVGGNDD